MMMAEAIVDILRINEHESVSLRRHSTGKVFLPNGGLTVLSRYLKTPQGSCHDLCKYGRRGTLQTLSKSATPPMPRIAAPKRAGAGQALERTQNNNLGGRRRKSEVGTKLSADFKILKPNDLVVIKIANAQGEQHEENAEANLAKPQTPDRPVFSLKRPSADDLVEIKTVESECEAQDEHNAETKFSEGENETEVGPKPSSGSTIQKPFDPDCIQSEVSSWTDKDFVSASPKKVPLPLNGTDVVVIAQASDPKLKPRSKLSSHLRHSHSSGKLNTQGSKSKETNLMSMTPVSSGRMISVMDDGKIVVPPSDSSFSKESIITSTSMNVRQRKERGVGHSKRLENAKQINPEKSCGENDKVFKNQKGVSHLMGQKNIKKRNSEECNFANAAEKTLCAVELNPENEHGEIIQISTHAGDFSAMPASSSKDKSMKHTRNRTLVGQSPQSNGKQKMIYRPKGYRAHGLSPSFSSSPSKKGLRSTPYGRYITQPSSLPVISTKYSSKSPSVKDLSQHDKVTTRKQKSNSKMMYRSKPNSEHKHLQGEKLNFQRDKVIEYSESKGKFYPEYKPAKSIQKSGNGGHFSTMTSLSFKRKGVKLTRNRISTNQSHRSYEKKNMIHRAKGTHVQGLSLSVSSLIGKKGLRPTPYGLHVSQPSLSSLSTSSKTANHDASLSQHDEVGAQKQKNSSKTMYRGRPNFSLITTSEDKHLPSEKLNFQRGKVIEAPLEEDCTPRRLAFKQRVHIDRKNGDGRNEKPEDYSPKRLKFKRRVLVDNRNDGDDNKNGGELFSPRRLKFRRRVDVDNKTNNANNQNDKCEDFIPRKLKLWRRVLDDNKAGSIQSSEGDTSKNNSEGRKANDADQNLNNATESVLQSNKIFLKRNGLEKKKDSGSLYNNMIEETTSRLARSKTSKVKALVSAFETVISDLDTKISTTSSTH